MSLIACVVLADTSLFIVGIAAMSYYGERHIAPGFQLPTPGLQLSPAAGSLSRGNACSASGSFARVLR